MLLCLLSITATAFRGFSSIYTSRQDATNHFYLKIVPSDEGGTEIMKFFSQFFRMTKNLLVVVSLIAIIFIGSDRGMDGFRPIGSCRKQGTGGFF